MMKRFLLIISVIMLMLVNMRSCALVREQMGVAQAWDAAHMAVSLQEEVELCLYRCSFSNSLKPSVFHIYAQEAIKNNKVLVQYTIDEPYEDNLMVLQECIDVGSLEFVITDKKNNKVPVQVCDGIVTTIPIQAEVAFPAMEEVPDMVVRHSQHSIDDRSQLIREGPPDSRVVDADHQSLVQNRSPVHSDIQAISIDRHCAIIHQPQQKKVTLISYTNSPACIIKSHGGKCAVKCSTLPPIIRQAVNILPTMILQAADTFFKLVTHELPCIAQLSNKVNEQKAGSVLMGQRATMVETPSQVKPVISQDEVVTAPAQKALIYTAVDAQEKPSGLYRGRSNPIHVNQEVAMLRAMLEKQMKQVEALTQQIEAKNRVQQYAHSGHDMVQEDVIIMLHLLVKRPDFGEYGIHSLLNLIDLEIDIVDYLRIDDKGAGFQDTINMRRTLFRRSMPSVQNAYSAIVDAAAQTAAQKTNLSNKAHKQIGNALAYALNSSGKQAFLQLMHNALAEYYMQLTTMRRNVMHSR